MFKKHIMNFIRTYICCCKKKYKLDDEKNLEKVKIINKNKELSSDEEYFLV